MNILYLAHRLPFPPNKGDKLRAFRHIRHLAKDHHVWCVCFVDRPGDFDYVSSLRTYCEDVIAVPLSTSRGLLRGAISLARGRTVTEGVYANSLMRRLLRDLSNAIRFDVVIAFSSSMAAYATSVSATRRVIDLCDLDSRKWRAYASHSKWPLRRLYDIEGRRLELVERRCVDEFDAVSVITDAEAEPLRADSSPDRVQVVTNGVDVPTTTRTPEALGRAGRVVGFLGVMNYRPNVDAVRWFVAACWPAVRKECPDAVFRIVGRWPCRAVRRLARVPGVVVVGEVQDIAPELDRFDVSVAPLQIACGLQNKILEAMAASVPLVLSAEAASCVGGQPGEDYLHATEGSDFATAVIRLLRDPTERERLGNNGRAFVARRHRWDDALRAFELFATGAITRTANLNVVVPASGIVANELAETVEPLHIPAAP